MMEDTIAVIGDIHGCPKTLLAILDEIPESVKDIYSVGDLIDRGPDSKQVIQICIDRGIKAVRGNHEDMFIDFLYGIKEYDEGIFLENGGSNTVASYGGNSYKVKAMYGNEYYSNPPEIPVEHHQFLYSMPYYIETDDLIISHAGIHSIYDGDHGMGIWSDLNNEKSKTSLMWNRMSIGKIGHKLQIFGHTPRQSVEFIKAWNPLDEKEDLIGINLDTGCGKGGPYALLSGILWPSLKIINVLNTDK